MRFIDIEFIAKIKLRRSHQWCFIKIVVLKNAAKFTKNFCAQSLFFNKVVALRHATLLKRDYGKDVSC